MSNKIPSGRITAARDVKNPGVRNEYLSLFTRLTAGSYDGITLLNKDLQIIYCTPSAERITGWTGAEIEQYDIIDLIHADDREGMSAFLEELLDSAEEPKQLSVRSRHADGRYLWLECTYTNFLNDPHIQAIIGNFRDVSEQKLKEEKLAKSDHFIQIVTDHLPVLITYWTADLRCLFANKTYAEWFGKKPGEMIGLNKKDLLGGREYAECTNYISQVLKGEPQNFERTFVRADRHKIDTYTQYLPDIADGQVKGFYSLISDVTELKSAQTEIRKKNEQIEDILDNINDGFIALDNNRGYTYVNQRAGEMIGIEPENLIGKNIWEVFPDAVGSVTYWAIETALEERRYICNEDHFEQLGLWQENRVYPASHGVSVFIRDITEKKELQRLLDEANNLARIGGWEVDLERRSVYWSQITRDIHEAEPGYNPDIEAATNFYMEGYSRETIAATMQNAAQYGMPGDVELQLVTANGNPLWVKVLVESEFRNDKCIRLYGSIQDIDARKRAEIAGTKALRERNIILESIGDAFFAVDNNWVVTYWNNMAEKVLRVPKDQIIDKNLWDVFSDSIGSVSYKRYHDAMATSKAVHFEDYYPLLGRWYEISVYPADNGLSVYFKDITDRKKADIQLKELNDSLQKQTKELAISNAELEQFAYVASHDLQEPLRMVTGFLSQLEKKYADVVDDKGRQYIHFAVDGAKRMRQIILDLLEFSRIGRTDDDMEEVDLNKVVGEICLLYHRQIEELHVEITYSGLPRLATFKTPIRQVFQNLIGNSLKYHSPGVAPKIEIGSRKTDAGFEISIKDNGIGIAPEYFEKIFVIFQRLHNQERYPGTGMGLAIAKKIIENLGGKIWVESEEEAGSTFYFTLINHL